MKRYSKIILAICALLFGISVFYVMLKSFSWQEVYDAIKLLSWTSLAVFMIAILTISVLKAIRFFIILRSGDLKVSFIKTIMIFISSQVFTPLPGGEIGRAVLFKNKLHLEMEQVATPVYLQAVIELWVAVFLALACIFFIKISFGIWFIVGLFLLITLLSVSIFIPKRLHDLLLLFKNKRLTYKWLDNLAQTLNSLEQFIVRKNGSVRFRLWMSIIFLGVASNIVAGLLVWYIARTQGVNMSFFQSIFTAVMAALIQGILFIIPGGLGITEGGLIGVLTSFSVRFKKAVIITLLFRAVMLPLLIIVGLVFLLFLYIPNILKNKKIHV